jgi:glycosyltransferase involved in cell wall biosynthesis/GT2 family glycosyltransferase
MPDDLVSIVIPAYNPTTYLLEAIASASAQTHRNVEIVLVNDGTDKRESLAILEKAARLVGVYKEQPNRGPAAARNTGFGATHGEYVVPLDADDLLDPAYVTECLAELRDSDAAFAYTDFRVFGTRTYQERPGEYNMYRLLDRNYLTYAALIRKHDWESSGGYDESLKCVGYEDWEFWLRLGARDRFGRYAPKSLFRYRKHGASLYDSALARHQDVVAYIRNRHPELYEYENRARVKARWSPAVSIIALEPPGNQTILDVQVIAPGELPLAPVVLTAIHGPPDGQLAPEAAELAALATWSGGAARKPSQTAARNRLHRHLLNAELLSIESWSQHPVRSFSRLIPLRVKERVNRGAGRPVFDLSFYLQFQPNSVLLGNSVIQPLRYYPKPMGGRKRAALITPHLGPGGAESVLDDIASGLRSKHFEMLLFATRSRDDRWLPKWQARVEHTYDLAQIVPPERMVGALCSMISNWRCDYLIVQNSLYGYAALPHIKKLLPEIKIVDVIHSVDDAWDQIASTAGVASHIDLRVAMSVPVRNRLLALGVPPEKILHVRNGVDLERFSPTAPPTTSSTKNILFAARLDPVKRALLVVDIAAKLSELRPQGDFRFTIAGDGPEKERFKRRVRKLALDAAFDFRGHVANLAPLYAAADVVILPSRSEGMPLVIIEALASARPVVASRVGSIPEILDSSCGILIDQPDPAAFAGAIHLLLDQPALREKMGAAGRRKMEASYDIRKTRETLAGLFDQGSSFDQGSGVSVSSTSRSTAIE